MEQPNLGDGLQTPSGASVQKQGILVRRASRENTALRPFVTRFAVINLIGVALIGAAWAERFLFKPFQADTSGMCYLIIILFAVGLVAVFRKDWQTVRWAGNAMVYLGMEGTVPGLSVTVSALTVERAQNFESFKTIVSSIYIGSGITLYTNPLACIGYLWLGTNAHLLVRQEVRAMWREMPLRASSLKCGNRNSPVLTVRAISPKCGIRPVILSAGWLSC
jgi:hypothetical protein